MSNMSPSSFSWDYNRLLLRLVRTSWQKLFHVEKLIMRRMCIKEFRPRPDDVCVVTYMRSGTTFLQMVLYQLLTDGNMNFRHLSDVSPLLEEAILAPKMMEALPSPRIFKTHGDYKYFPKETNGKLIYVVRNGMDVASSMFHYYKDYNMPHLEWDKFLNETFMKKISWFKHVADWMENEKGLDVLYLQYESLNKDLPATIKKLSAFLNINPSEETVQRVLERCSFSYMKQHEQKFGRPRISLDKVDVQFIRKGESGKGQMEFNDQQREKFIRLYNKYLGKYNLGYDFSSSAVNLNHKPAEKVAV